ncbi:MAG: SDR family oxidoreductase [Dehalococcoidales bacterium]|nr:SDR family oxidoreductase [Dehalococcoidales bacterium]
MNRQLLPGKVAIINGGSTGMGRSTALIFAEEGCNVVIADINEKDGIKTAEEASARGAEAIFVKCDITDLKDIKACVDKTVEKFGTVHILIGCAGGSVPRDRVLPPLPPGEVRKMGVEYTDEKYFDLMTNLNYKGHVFFAKEVVPYMKKQQYGKMVLISSQGVYTPPGPSVEYHGAKGAIIGLVYNLAYELGPSHINVNGILPGPIKTPFWDPVLANLPEAERDGMLDGMGQFSSIGRVGQPEDIGYTILFLCSEEGSYIHGQMINVGGGIPLGRYDPERGFLRRPPAQTNK